MTKLRRSRARRYDSDMSHKKRQRPKDTDSDKIRDDVNELAFRTVQAALGLAEKPVPPEERTDAERDPRAVERGRKGGQKGGVNRATKLTGKQRQAIARRAAQARWDRGDAD